jgi:hypothetical protein
MLFPLRVLLGDWLNPIIWGILLMIVYFRSHNPMLTSFVGVLVAGFLAQTTSNIDDSGASSLFNQGYILVAISVGAVLFFLFRQKANNPGGV